MPTITGATTGNDSLYFKSQPANSGGSYTVDGLAGTDTFNFADSATGTGYQNRFPVGNFKFNGVTLTAGSTYNVTGTTAVVTGASSNGGVFTMNFTSVETLKLSGGTVYFTYGPPNANAPIFTSGSTGTVTENAAITTVIYTATATDADGTAPTYSLSGADAALLNINAATGAVTLKSSADYETKASYSFNVVASDGLAAHDVTKAIVVSVNNLNDNAPVVTSSGTGTVDENAATSTVIYTATATDADNLGALTYSLSGADAALLNINATTGAVTLQASANYETKTSYSFNVVASDGTLTGSKAVTVSVYNLNDNSPVVTSGGTGTVDENAATSTVIYTTTATDADNLAALTYSLSGADAALLNINASTGAVTLKASADFETKAVYSFNVVASDGLAAHDATKAVVVSVNNLNDNLPVVTSGGTGTVDENAATTTVIYTATATDADNLGALTYSLSGADAALLNINATTGGVTLKSSANYEMKASYSFNVVASDGLAAHDATKAVIVSVNNLNDNAPVFTSSGTGTVDENAAISTVIYTATATDADNLGALTYSLSGADAALLNINATTGAVTLQASANYETKASYSFNVVASDGTLTGSKAVTVSVNNLNDNSPVVTSGGTGTVVENAATSTVIYTATATDADNLAALTYSLSGSDAALLNINASTGAVTLKAPADYETKTSYSFSVIASDGLPAHDVSKGVLVSVTNLNDNAPQFTSGGSAAVVNQSPVGTVIYTAVATDADNLGALTYSLNGTDASLLNIDTNLGLVSLKSAANYLVKTSYNFNVVASDGSNNTTKAIVVNVQPTNNVAPEFTSGSTGTVVENAATGTVIYTATATDGDANTLSYSLSGTDASLLNIDASTGAVTLKASADYETKTSYSFSVIASDGLPAHDVSKGVLVSVTNLNDNTPVFTSGSTGSVVENAATNTVIYTAVATDSDNLGALTYALSGTDVTMLNINSSTGEVTLKSSADYEQRTSYSFSVTASDGTNIASKSVVVGVLNANDNAPVFTSGTSGTVVENAATGTVIYTAVANDADNLGALTYSLGGTDALLLNINSSTGDVTLKNSANYENKTSYSFIVIAGDGDPSHNATQSVVVSVTNVNDNAPVFTSGTSGSVQENAATSTVIYTASATDADNLGALTYALGGTDASLLNINSSTGEVMLKSSADYEQKTSYIFSVTASDGLSAHDVSKSVVVSVTNLNDNAPVITSGSTGTVAENAATSTVVYTATATDTDNLGALTYSLSGTDASLLSIDAATGAVRLNASANYETKTSYNFNVVASDGLLSNDAAKAITISVTNLNDNAPQFTSGGSAAVVNQSPAGTVIYTAVATDADNLGALTYSLNGTDASLLNIDTSTGDVTLKSSANYSAKSSYNFNVVASDGSNNTPKAIVVNVQPTNNVAPQFTSGNSGTVDENAAANTVVYTASATDADGNPLTYSLSGTDAGRLNIDGTTGAVTLISSADYETKTSYSFNVTVSDGLSAHDATKAVTISVNNLNDNAPQFTSGSTGTVTENAATSTVIYTATATDADNLAALTYTLSGTDAGQLNIDAATGEVRLNSSADYEMKTSYSFSVTASDGLAAHNVTKAVVISVTNMNDNAPVFTSGSTGAVVENDAISTVIYTVAATDADNLAALTYSLSGPDAGQLNIDAVTGAVTLKASADYETKTSYSFSVTASDGLPAHDITKAIDVSVINLNDNSPQFTSGGTGTVTENASPNTVIYTASATDVDNLGSLTYTLSGTDAALLNFDAITGAVRLKDSADYESKASYSFNIVASDGAKTTTQVVSVPVVNVDEAPVSSNDSVVTHDTVNKVFGIDDFGLYHDPEGAPLAAVQIVSRPLPAFGTLQYTTDGSTWLSVAVDQVITSREISLGHVRFMPVIGMSTAEIGFNVSDGGLNSISTYTLTVYAEQIETLPAVSNQPITGTGLTADVPADVTLFADSLPDNGLPLHDQIASFSDHLINDEASGTLINHAIDTYISGVADQAAVSVRELEFHADAAFNTANHITITGNPTGQEALVIDASQLPRGTVLDLHNVEFAVIIGLAHIEGGTGNNIVVADGNDQYIVLGEGDDKLDGGGGNDTIGSHAGNDTLIGGTGDDTVIYFGAFSHYSISYDSTEGPEGTYKVVDTTGVDGTDTVSGFEHFQFTDKTFDLQNPLDTTAPTVTSITPVSGSTGAGITDNIVVKFSEDVILRTGTIAIRAGSSDGNLIEGFNTVDANPAHLSLIGDTLTINPSVNLANSTDYYVTFSDGSIQDFAGHLYTGTSTYHFSTVAAAYAATGGSSSGGGAGVVLAGAAGLGLLAWLVL
jgi:type III secretion system FlhB-like substrate exporter